MGTAHSRSHECRYITYMIDDAVFRHDASNVKARYSTDAACTRNGQCRNCVGADYDVEYCSSLPVDGTTIHLHSSTLVARAGAAAA